MTRVILDAGLRQKLKNFTETLEICDESGKVQARLIPYLDPKEYGPLEPQVSDEELIRRSQSNEPTYTTAEVLAYLEKL